jgi:uncharacterized GH25 family protein
MKPLFRAVIALLVLLPASAPAHRTWLLPSSTVLSADDPWITVDAAAGNELFHLDHRALPLHGLAIVAPDGSQVDALNRHEGRYRSSFDVKLAQQGTYRVSLSQQGLFASYRLDGERKRWRGNAAQLDAAIPQAAQELRIREVSRRVETFVTVGAPKHSTLAPRGEGLELEFGVHPNDLFSGETAGFRLLLAGEAAAGVEVHVIPGGSRYRNVPAEMKFITAADGRFEITWPAPGMYWLSAEVEDTHTSEPRAGARHASYTVTLEVLPQ